MRRPRPPCPRPSRRVDAQVDKLAWLRQEIAAQNATADDLLPLLDPNGDGACTVEEFRVGMLAAGIELEAASVRQLYRATSDNIRDNSNKTLSVKQMREVLDAECDAKAKAKIQAQAKAKAKARKSRR